MFNEKLEQSARRVVELCSLKAPIYIIDAERRKYRELHEQFIGQFSEELIDWD